MPFPSPAGIPVPWTRSPRGVTWTGTRRCLALALRGRLLRRGRFRPGGAQHPQPGGPEAGRARDSPRPEARRAPGPFGPASHRRIRPRAPAVRPVRRVALARRVLPHLAVPDFDLRRRVRLPRDREEIGYSLAGLSRTARAVAFVPDAVVLSGGGRSQMITPKEAVAAALARANSELEQALNDLEA